MVTFDNKNQLTQIIFPCAKVHAFSSAPATYAVQSLNAVFARLHRSDVPAATSCPAATTSATTTAATVDDDVE
uniref:Uncharacterized protein n=1 Tax=Oryza brachyantha TaxID=4533 RepID=J3MBG1_ORYBR